MEPMTPESWVYLVALAAFTVAATVWDIRYRRIPNALTVSFFLLGLAYRAWGGWSGLGDALLGFLVGFGMMFLLWMIGASGGGDAKLIGALAVWFGLKQTLALIFLSGLVVIVLSILRAVARVFRRGLKRVEQEYRREEEAKLARQKRRRKETRDEKIAARRANRLMAYALPVSIAAWVLVLAEIFGRMPDFLKKPPGG